MINNLQVVAAALIMGLMIVCTVEDVKKKQIHVVKLIAFVVLNLFLAWCTQKEWKTMVAGGILGVFLFIISVCTKEKLGRGDAVIVGGMGVYLGFHTALMVIFIALLMVCIYGLVLLCKKKSLSYEVAFVPFLMVPYVSAVVLQMSNNSLLA